MAQKYSTIVTAVMIAVSLAGNVFICSMVFGFKLLNNSGTVILSFHSGKKFMNFVLDNCSIFALQKTEYSPKASDYFLSLSTFRNFILCML